MDERENIRRRREEAARSERRSGGRDDKGTFGLSQLASSALRSSRQAQHVHRASAGHANRQLRYTMRSGSPLRMPRVASANALQLLMSDLPCFS
jgi:hypothetical protein